MNKTLDEIKQMYPIGTIYCPTNTNSKRIIKTNIFKFNGSFVHYIDENGKQSDNELCFCLFDGNNWATIIKLGIQYEIY